MGVTDNKSAPQPVAPQNSFTQMRQKLGLLEHETLNGQEPNSSRKQTGTKASATHCLHCENMAKNFLYLESLVRSNYNSKEQCSLCYSTLKYLQYVNKNIADVFGNFDSIVQAAKAFTLKGGDVKKGKVKLQHSHLLAKIRTAAVSGEATAKPSSKQQLTKQKSKINRLVGGSSKQTTGRKAGLTSPDLPVLPKQMKTLSKNPLKKITSKKTLRVPRNSRRTQSGSVENAAKSTKSLSKPLVRHKVKTVQRRSVKPKKIKSKHSKKGSSAPPAKK